MAGRRGGGWRTLRLAAGLLLLAGCEPPPAGGQDGGQDRGTAQAGPVTPPATRRIELAAEPWVLLAEPGGLWVGAGDRTLARFDTATGRADGPPVRLPFTPGALAAGHGALWVAGQVDGRRRVTAEGSYPVIQLARVDPRRRVVVEVLEPPLRSNGNRLVSTPNAVWVTDPAEGPQSRVWRVDPATGRLLRPPLRGGEEPLAVELHQGAVWSANHDDGTLRRMDARTGTLQATIDLGVEPHGMAVGHGAVWVADAHHQAVLRVDPGGGGTVARVPVGFEPGPLVATRTAVWVAGSSDPDLPRAPLARIDPAANRVTAAIPLDGQATALAGDGERAWVGTAAPDAVLQLPA